MRRLLPLLAALALLATPLGAAGARAAIGISPARGFVPHQVIYKLEGRRGARALSLPDGVGVRQTAAALRRNPRVAYAEPNYIATASALAEDEGLPLPDDPGTLGGADASSEAGDWAAKQWNFLPWEEPASGAVPISPGGIDVVGTWRNLEEAGAPGGAHVVVAVLDTGIAYRTAPGGFTRSPDFTSQQFVKGYDFVGRDSVPVDRNGHGTHVAGTIAEKTNNGIGLAGIAYRAKLMPVRVLDKRGRGDAVGIARGIDYAVSHGADVINMSFNFECARRVPLVDEALRNAYDEGVIAVASAGNLGSETCVSEPATGPRVIAVGGTTEGGCLGDYSLAGAAVDLVAPGGGEPRVGCPSILSRPIYQVTFEPGSRGAFDIPGDYAGTSMAAAHVSGVAALLVGEGFHSSGKHRFPRPPEIVNAVTARLRRTARDLGLPRTQQGAGLIDAARATEQPVQLG